MATDLNVSLILRLVDKATAPARAALREWERQSGKMAAAGRAQVVMSGQQIAAAQERSQRMLGEAAAIAGTGYAMVQALQPAIKFEAQMAKVGAVSRASEGEMAQLTETARRLGRETPWSATQAAEGMQYLAMAGFKVTETVEAMPGMLDLASAGAIELGAAADIASNVLTGFGMKAGEMGRLGDVLTNTFTTSNTNLAMLGETMKYVSAPAASLGVDLETVSAMAGKLGDAGIQGSEAGTALRGVMLRLAAPGKDAAKVLENLQVSTRDANGDLRNMPDILADLDKAMSDYGTAAKAEMAKVLFETEAMAAGTILMGQAGSGALQAYIQSLNEVGSAARVATEINDNTAGALKTLASRAESLSISIGSTLLPILVEMVENLVPVIDGITAWAAANPELIKTIGWFAVGLLGMRAGLFALRFAFQPLLMAFWLFNGTLGAAVWAFGSVGGQISRFGRRLGWLGRLLPLVTGSVGFLLKAVWGLGQMAIAVASFAWPLLLTSLHGVLRVVATMAVSMLQLAKGALMLLGRAALALATGGMRVLASAIGFVGRALMIAGRAALANPLMLVLSLIAGMAYVIYQNWDGIVAYFQAKIDRVRAAFDQGLLNGVLKLLSEFNPFRLMYDAAEGLFKYLTGWSFADVTNALISAFTSIDFVKIGADMMQAIWEGFKSIIGAFGAWLSAKIASFMPDIKGMLGMGDTRGSRPAENYVNSSNEFAGVDGGRATGGPVRAGGIYRWHEEGHEMFSPSTDGTVINARRVKALAGGGKSAPSFHIGGITINAAAGQSPSDIAREVKRQLEQMARAQGAALHDGGSYA